MQTTPANILYRRLFGYLRRYFGIFSISIISMIVVAITMPLFARLIKPLIDEGFTGQNIEMITWLPLAIVGLFIVHGVFNFLNAYTNSYIAGHLVQTLRQELFNKLLRLPNDYYLHNNSGRIINRILGDAAQITDAGFNVLTVLFKDGISVFALMIYLFYLDWKLTLITLVTLPIVGLCVRLVSKRLRKLSSESQKLGGHMLQTLSESVNGNRVIKIYGGEEREISRFKRFSEEVRRNGIKQTAASSASSAITVLLVSCALSLILYLAAHRAQNSTFSAGDFMSFLTAMIMMFDPIKRLTGVINSLQRGLAAAESVFDFLDEPEEPDWGTQMLPENTGDITFHNVVHRYEDTERNSLNDISFTVPQGKVYALVGASGCGKTTLVNLLPRFFSPISGSISIGGTDIQQYRMASLRERIAIVSQDVVLFNGSIAENIAYGAQSKANEAEIIAAAQAANAWEFIQKLPQGLNTQIGENGAKLSGGQRQRIAIARALLKNAPILILDEATSALDNESERLVQAALENLMQNRTTIVIAHRLSTIENADQIVVMHEGKIVEQGTHTTLLSKHGRYADLHNLQFKE
ncbi:MAG: lipid A export permease/ATP-binding protein MsbA [Alysiella sp.]|uniref:lipid A export permease/ATP-binding protein MsbA n=1 Tax=Alysiella sp. TaxID=1872483 RepID=UPI0026DA8E20|nr:lipid A export permease/ATP-binding protein MsbA [Alysiella sp.]MDO4433920.1 lipid A export permease/ATP-binding protein MsbA [Alysiella sp.]